MNHRRQQPIRSTRRWRRLRRGVSSLDYILTLGVTLPLIGFVLWGAPLLMNRIYQIFCVFVGWPFP